MSLIPSFNPDASHPKGYRPFTDRNLHIDSVRRALDGLTPESHRVIVFYGFGGIGKTSLCNRVSEILDDKSGEIYWVKHDFSNPALRDADDALFYVKRMLCKKYGFRFPCFDIAYTEYWAKTHGQVCLTTAELPFLDEGDLLAEILNTVEQVPGIGLVTKIPKVLHKLSRGLREWWTEFGEDALQGISDLDATGLEERLPGLWALDLKRQLGKGDKRLVLILDTYEALREHQREESQRHSVDAWVREWVTHLPGVLWIIAGRDRLYWDEVRPEWSEVLSQYPLGDLSDDDARSFLAACRIVNPAIQAAIVQAAKGVPYDLDLAVDHYSNILAKGARNPVPVDFGRTPFELFSRFCKYLDDSEVGALELLAVPRSWNKELVGRLLQHFGCGFPVQHFSKLLRFSFVTDLEDGTYALHARMREALQSHARYTNVEEVHAFLFSYHATLLEELDDRDLQGVHRRALEEAFHHGIQSRFDKLFSNWFERATQPFIKNREWRVLIPLYDRILVTVEAQEGGESEGVAHRLYDLAAAYQGQGRYNIAEPLYRRALRVFEHTLGRDHLHVALTCTTLAVLHRQKGDYAEAEALHTRALAIREKQLGRDHLEVARTLNSLAVLYAYQSRFAEAEALYREVLSTRQEQLPADHPEILLTLSNLAGMYWFQDNRGAAEPLYLRVLVLQERQLDSDHPDLAQTLHNLSVLYRYDQRYADAETLGKRALEIRENAFGAEHVDVGQSLDALATILRDTGRLNDAKPLYTRALRIFEAEFGRDHPATMVTISNMAVLYDLEGRHAEADSLHAQALAVADKLSFHHPYISRVKKAYAERPRE